VCFTPDASSENFTGKVFLYLSKDNKKPKNASVGLSELPFFSIAVKNIKPNEAVVFDDSALSYPVVLSDLEKNDYYVQAVWDRNQGGRAIGNSPGNMFNNVVKVKFSKNTTQIFTIICAEKNKNNLFVSTSFSKELKLHSALLTAFFKKPDTLYAAVLLPKEYDTQIQRKFPVLYSITGYGGNYHRYSGKTSPAEPLDTTACIRVILDGNCPLGHSVYANSDNNGPVGDALVQELIPLIEKNFRCNGARLLFGHSSGGWTALWLQTQYPKTFTACWSSSPDPVDFRSFQKVDLYADKNMFYDKDSSLRNVATVGGGIPWASMKSIYGQENVIWRGEQMHSFDAVFSTKNADGTPRAICNPYTGEIDPVTVSHWRNYDISLLVRANWDKNKKDLDGKVRVSVGNSDNFLLNYAVHMFEEEMKKLNSKFVFQYYPGDHFTVNNSDNMHAGQLFLEEKYVEYLKDQSPVKKPK
jgi:S-formylglutathione hydrolase FrmB